MDQFVKMNENTNEQEEQQATATQSSGVKIVSRAGKELVVEVYGEASHCLDGVGEDNPAVLLDWKPMQVRAAVALANRDRPALPDWIQPGCYPITEEMLTLGLIQDISDAVSGTAVGGFLFAPNSLLQYGQIREHLVYLMMGDHFILHICRPVECRPLANIFVFVDEQRKKTAVAVPCKRLPLGRGGVQAFE